mmetsp:Transcript_52600/g.87102  ORF Transcript_52600/g.87102 Transcript_52600/m.87102 type:complete len:260 (-) Transcript_52600:286-1065(-)
MLVGGRECSQDTHRLGDCVCGIALELTSVADGMKRVECFTESVLTAVKQGEGKILLRLEQHAFTLAFHAIVLLALTQQMTNLKRRRRCITTPTATLFLLHQAHINLEQCGIDAEFHFRAFECQVWRGRIRASLPQKLRQEIQTGEVLVPTFLVKRESGWCSCRRQFTPLKREHFMHDIVNGAILGRRQVLNVVAQPIKFNVWKQVDNIAWIDIRDFKMFHTAFPLQTTQQRKPCIAMKCAFLTLFWCRFHQQFQAFLDA